jgi:hypothetical protein
MVLLILVGIYALIAKRIRVTQSFQLTGVRARNYGLTLILLAFPARLFVNLVIRPLLPLMILSNRMLLSLANVSFLALVLFGIAWLFRDKTPTDSPRGASEA